MRSPFRRARSAAPASAPTTLMPQWSPAALDAVAATVRHTTDAWASDPDRTTRRETYTTETTR